MSDEIRHFKQDVEKLKASVELLEKAEGLDVLKIVMKSMIYLLAGAAPVLSKEYKVVALIFSALSSTLKVVLKDMS